MEKKLRKSLERAEKYLEIVRRINQTKELIGSEIAWLYANSSLLQNEVEKFGFGVIMFREAFTMRVIPNLPLLTNFPIMLQQDRRKTISKDALALIPSLFQTLLGYMQTITEILENPDELKKIELQKVTFFSIMKDIKKNFRKVFYTQPMNEKDVQAGMQSFLAVNNYGFKREKDSVGFSEKGFEPDFTNNELSIAIEIKFLDAKEKVASIIEGMSADITPYAKKWGNILFVVYDRGGNIRDIDEFTKDFIQNKKPLIRCVVIKH